MEDVRRAGGKPFPIPAGCSEHPLGGLGFVGFAEEVRAQESRARLQVRLHRRLLGDRQHAGGHGGRFRRRRPRGARDRHRRLGQAARRRVRRSCASPGTPPSWSSSGATITEQDVVLDTRYGGPEYGLPNAGTLEAIRLCARQEGMLTDPVYEGKSMHGMIDMVRKGEFPAGSRVLYAHLGGVPALNAYSFLFRNG